MKIEKEVLQKLKITSSKTGNSLLFSKFLLKKIIFFSDTMTFPAFLNFFHCVQEFKRVRYFKKLLNVQNVN